MQDQSLNREDPLEEGIATRSSILAWRIPWMGEPGGLQSQGRKESDMTEVTQHSTTTFTMLYIRFPELIHLVAERFYTLTNVSPFYPLHSPWQPPFYSVFMNLTIFKDSTCKVDHTNFLSLSGLFLLAKCPSGSPTSLHRA